MNRTASSPDLASAGFVAALLLALGAAAFPILAIAKQADAGAPAVAEEEDPLAKIFGEGGMELKALGENGGMTAEFDEETQEMTAMRIWGEIDLASELMNLACQEIQIDMVAQKMVAKGRVVNFRKDDLEGRCGLLTYDIETKKTFLSGDPKPLIRQQQTNGSTRQTSADNITIIRNEKSNNILWDGNPELSVIPAPAKKDSGGAEKPKKIDGGTLREIPVRSSAP